MRVWIIGKRQLQFNSTFVAYVSADLIMGEKTSHMLVAKQTIYSRITHAQARKFVQLQIEIEVTAQICFS